MTLLGFVSNFKNHKYPIWYSCWLKWCSFSPHIQARPPCNTLWVVTVNLQHPAPVAWKPPQQPCVWISHMSLWWSNVLSVGLHRFHQCVRKKKKKKKKKRSINFDPVSGNKRENPGEGSSSATVTSVFLMSQPSHVWESYKGFSKVFCEPPPPALFWKCETARWCMCLKGPLCNFSQMKLKVRTLILKRYFYKLEIFVFSITE